MLGSLQPSGNLLLVTAAAALAAGTIVLTFYGRDIDAVTFGEETAFSFGADPRMLSYLLLGVASVLAACSVAVAGIISFVGLIAPHVIRRLFGAGHTRLFPLCLALGGIFLMTCDTFARCIWESMNFRSAWSLRLSAARSSYGYSAAGGSGSETQIRPSHGGARSLVFLC
jgi:iron complex transport system permease protein